MDALETFQKYVAIKLHFQSSYDYFKYQGKVRTATPKAFETRKDKYYFHKLSKKENLELFLASVFLTKRDVWVGNLFDEECQEIYIQTLKRIQSMEYTFTSDMSKFESLNDALNVSNGEYPKLLKEYQRGNICHETLVILNEQLGIFEYWSSAITDNFLWPTIRNKLEKYSRFVQYDKEKFKRILFTFA
jgi:hypothetical protein